MASTAIERSWLMDRTVLQQVRQCRRLIQMEFGVKLHLTEDKLEQQLADYAARSRSDQLTRTWFELCSSVPELDQLVPGGNTEDIKTRVYRGQAVAENTREAAPDRPARTIIYRGQVITR